MKQKRFSVEQIVAVLKQAEAGVPLAELIRRVGISEQTFYRWKKVSFPDGGGHLYPGMSGDRIGAATEGEDMVTVLSRIKVQRGVPKMLYCDNGSEFSSQAMDLWTYQNGVRMAFSRPGSSGTMFWSHRSLSHPRRMKSHEVP